MNKIKNIIAKLLILFLLLANSTPAYARIVLETEFLIENSGNAWILDSQDDVTGDVTLQFGNSLGETITFDTTNSEFDISNNLNLGQNQLKDVVIDNLNTAPGTPVIGQLYYDTVDDKMYMWNGSAWQDVIAEPHAASHVDGTDDIQLATISQKGLMSAQYAQDLEDATTQNDEINRNTIDVQLDLGEYVASSVAYLTYDNPGGTNFVANIENVEFTINDSPTTGIALTGGSDASPTLNYVYVKEDTGSAYVEASTTDPSGQAFDYVPIGEVLLGTVGVSSATYYYIENLTNYIRNFIGDTNNRLRVTGVIWLSGVAISNTGLEIATTQGTVIHMHETITYSAKDTTADDMTDFYYNVYTALDNTNYDDGTGGNTAIGNNKFHKLFIWGDIYGGLHMERQQKPSTSEYTSAEAAEDDSDSVAVAAIPSSWGTVGFPIAHLVLQEGTADVLKFIDLRGGGGGSGGGTVAGGHTQGTDVGTTEDTFTLDLDNTATDITLTFGAALGETLKWDNTNSEFDLSDDLNLAQAQLRGAAIDNLAAAPGTPVAGQIYHNTTNNNTYIYNGSAWEDITIDNFEKLYTSDGDNTLTTSDGTFTINTGTDDFVVTSNDWTVDISGNLTANNITSDGTFDANGIVTIGDNGEGVTIDSNTWDISSAGAISGLTTIGLSGSVTTSAGDFIIGTTGITETTAANDSGAYIIGTFDEFTNSASANVQDVLDDLDAFVTDFPGTNSNTFIIDRDDTGGNVTLQFGTALSETLLWDNANTRFTFSDDVRVENNLAVIGQGYIAADHAATDSDGILNLGLNGSAWENLIWDDSDGQFEFSDDVSITGGINVSANIDANLNQLVEARAENLGSAPTCDAGSAGRIYHDTSSTYSYICNGTSWERIDEAATGSSIVMGSFYDSAGGTDINVATPVAVGWNQEVRKDGGLTHSTSTNNSRVTLNVAGWYKTSYNVSYEDQTGNRKNIRCRIRLNGTTYVTPSDSYSYVRNTTDEWGTNTATTIFQTTSASEYYEVMCNGEGTAVGSEAANTVASQSWSVVEKIGGTPAEATDFEGVYSTDVDNTLTTTNNAFTINTGTSDFIVTSNDWTVDASGNLTANNITSNGTLDANGVVTIGDNGDAVTIDSNTWDVSSAGVASGLTGLTSTGTIDFSGATRMAMHQGAANPATCTEGDLFYNTTDNYTYTCTAANTWTALGKRVPDMNYFKDTTADAVNSANDTTNYWDEAAENGTQHPNITPSSTNSEVLIMATISYLPGSTADRSVVVRLERNIGADPTCGSSTQVGDENGWMTSDSDVDGVSMIFIDSPATTSTAYYTLCSDAEGSDSSGQIAEIHFTLYEMNNAADLAEVYATNDISLTSGDLVSFDPTLTAGVKKSTGAYDPKLLGVVSTQPAKTIGGTGGEGLTGIPIALSGRVPVKVSTENGPIQPGDMLTTSSIPGVAMKATKPAYIIGRAFNSFVEKGIGMVLAFVGTHFADPTIFEIK